VNIKTVWKGVCALLLLIIASGLVVVADDNTYTEGWISGGALCSLTTGSEHRLDITVNQPLVAIDWKGGLQPLLAESWEKDAEGKVWIFHLRNGVEWDDGVQFTAEDVVFSFNTYVDPKVNSRRHYWLANVLGYDEFRAGTADSLAGVQVLDEYTVRVELKEALPLWVKLSATYIVIFPEHILGDVSPEEVIGDSYWMNRVGTGPFKWVKYVPDQYIELVRNENYFLGAPQIEHLIYRFYSDAASHVAALERGEIDMTAYEGTLINLDDVQRVSKASGVDVVVMSKGMPNFIRFNHNRPEWSDIRIRQAIRYAINVDGIMENLMSGYGLPAYTAFPQAWAIPDGLNKYEYNPGKARQLLEEAGWDSNREVDFVYEYGDLDTQNQLLAIQADLAQVGMKVNLRKVDAATSVSLWETGDFDMGYYGFGMGVDPQLAVAIFNGETYQSGGYNSPRALELFDEALQYESNEDRQSYYHEIAAIANEEQPCVWLWYAPRPLGFNLRVWGPYEHYSEQGIIYFNMPVYNEIEKWYIKPGTE